MTKTILIRAVIMLWCCSPCSSFGYEVGRAVIPSKDIQVIVETFDTHEGLYGKKVSEDQDKEDPAKQTQESVVTKKPPIIQAGTKLPINRMTNLKVSVRSIQDAGKLSGAYDLVFFDARMPEHNHGMVVQPKISRLDDLHWKVEGFKLHMKGLWQFYLTVKVGQAEEKVSFELDI